MLQHPQGGMRFQRTGRDSSSNNSAYFTKGEIAYSPIGQLLLLEPELRDSVVARRRQLWTPKWAHLIDLGLLKIASENPFFTGVTSCEAIPKALLSPSSFVERLSQVHPPLHPIRLTGRPNMPHLFSQIASPLFPKTLTVDA